MRVTRRIVRGVLYGTAGIALASAASIVPAGAATPARPGGTAAGVPAGFIAESISWITPAQGWVLGTTSCGKAGNCPTSDVIGTSNGGGTWRQIGKIAAPVPKAGNASSGITEIRFATAKVGWAFGPGLWRTADGGRTWKATRIPGRGRQVLSLAVSATAAYAIVSPCAFGTGLCSSKPLTTWRIGTSARSWTRMPVSLRTNVAANVAAYGGSVYLVNPAVSLPHTSQLFVSTDGGARFASRRVPCTAQEENTLIQAVPYSATKVGFLCDGNPGFGKAVKAVYLSSNNGKTDTYAGTLGLFGIEAQLAISPAGNLAVAAWSIGSFMYINDGHRTKWFMVIGSGDGGAGWNDVTYVSAKVAWVVYSPAELYPGIGKLYVTRDAGRHWSLAKF